MGFPNVRIVKIFTFGENVMEQHVKEVLSEFTVFTNEWVKNKRFLQMF